jgi:hypothetical protein
LALPVNYTVAGGIIVIQTGAGSLIAVHRDGQVSFEADHFDLEPGRSRSLSGDGRWRRRSRGGVTGAGVYGQIRVGAAIRAEGPVGG